MSRKLDTDLLIGWSLVHKAHTEGRPVRVKLSCGRGEFVGHVIQIADTYYRLETEDGSLKTVIWNEADGVGIEPAYELGGDIEEWVRSLPRVLDGPPYERKTPAKDDYQSGYDAGIEEAKKVLAAIVEPSNPHSPWVERD